MAREQTRNKAEADREAGGGGTGSQDGSEPPDLRAIVNSSEMVSRPGCIMRRLLRRFERVGFDLGIANRLHEAGRQGHVVYVLDRQSTLDYLYFNYAFLKLSLPLVYFANGVSTLLYRPLLRALGYLFKRLFRRVHLKLDEASQLAAGVQAGRASLLFLRRRRALIQFGGGLTVTPHLVRLLELQRTLEKPILLCPLAVFWDTGPARYHRSLLDLVFGSNNAPGRVRKLVGFLRYSQSALVRSGEPIDLKAFLSQHDDATSDKLAERLEWALHHGLGREERPIRGPILKKGKRVREEILRQDSFRTMLERRAEDSGRSLKSVTKEARGHLKEMAADFHIRYIEAFCVVLTLLWNRVFAGLDVDKAGLARLREAAKDAPVVLVPAHRSHMDYLAISYLFYTHGLIPPHIAAGINLSFWPLGHIFRRCGAFFLRRSFRGKPLYAECFEAYIRKLIKEGYWIEFFIEGGRSRTGKCLPPKLGLLSDIVAAVTSGATRDLNIVPVSIGYERIMEEGAYSRELDGGEKTAENLTELLRSSKALRARYGHLYLRFGEPLRLMEYVREQGFEHDEATAEDLRRLTTRLGHRVIEGINDITVVTTTALVSSALLCHPKRGITRRQLQVRVGLLLEIAGRQGAPMATALRVGLQARRLELGRAEQEAIRLRGETERPSCDSPQANYEIQRLTDEARGLAIRESIDEGLGYLIDRKLVRVDTFDSEVVYTPVEEGRMGLEIYKNAFVHRLVPLALASTAILAEREGAEITAQAISRRLRFLLRLLRLEFAFTERERWQEMFDATRDYLLTMGLLVPCEGHASSLKVHPKAYHLLRFFHNAIASFLDTYRFAAGCLPALLESQPTRKELVKNLRHDAWVAYRAGDIRRRESISSVTLGNVVDFFIARGFISKDDRGRLGARRAPEKFARWEEQIGRMIS